jgi:hypothetical protein
MRQILTLPLVLLVLAVLGGCGEAPSVLPHGSDNVDWRNATYVLVEEPTGRLDMGVSGEGATVTFTQKNYDLRRWNGMGSPKGD